MPEHNWIVFSTALVDACLMLECSECHAYGTVDNPTREEWNRAFHAPSTPYVWRGGDDRVVVKGKLVNGVFETCLPNDQTPTTLLELLRQIEDGYEEDYLLCDECAEGGCDGIDCKCACHASAGRAKSTGRIALAKLRQVLEGVPDYDTIDLGIPCAKCGGTDGWVCECSSTPIDPRRSTQMLRAKITNEPIPFKVQRAIEIIAAYLCRGGWQEATISADGKAPFYLASERKFLFERIVEEAKCNCHLHKPGELTGGWQCPVHGAQF